MDFLADDPTERLNLRANIREDALEELRKLASEKEGPTSVVVTQSVEGALMMAEQEYRISGRSPQMSYFITGASFLVAEALPLLEASVVGCRHQTNV